MVLWYSWRTGTDRRRDSCGMPCSHHALLLFSSHLSIIIVICIIFLLSRLLHTTFYFTHLFSLLFLSCTAHTTIFVPFLMPPSCTSVLHTLPHTSHTTCAACTHTPDKKKKKNSPNNDMILENREINEKDENSG